MEKYRKTVRVSHIGSSENHDSESQVGNIIVNFLISSKIDPNANVALLVATTSGTVARSLYDFDPWAPISTLPGSPSLMLTCLNFETVEEKRKALDLLVTYLEGVHDKSYEDNNLMEKAILELERLPPARFVERPRTVLTGARNHYVPTDLDVADDIVTGDAAPGKFSPEDTAPRGQLLYSARSPVRGDILYTSPSRTVYTSYEQAPVGARLVRR